jgi:Fe-S-cluster containining protein
VLKIKDTLVSLDIVERHFACDLSHCMGACCIEGDAGAPLEEGEESELKRILPEIWNDLGSSARVVIHEQGVACVDIEGDTVTTIVNGKDCVFSHRDESGICKCAIETAYRQGRINWPKPISCRLYPVRVKDYGEYKAVNYNRWNICKSAEILGVEKQIPIYQYLREALIDKFGEEWYAELEIFASEWKKSRG